MNLLLRIVSGAVLIGIVGAALWLGTASVAALIGAGVLVACWELAGLLGKLRIAPPWWLLYPLALWLAIRLALPAAYQDAQWPLLAALSAGLLAAVLLRVSFDRWAGAVAAAVYAGFGLGFFLALYLWHGADSDHFGLRLVGLVLLAVIAGDVAAYFTGSAVGRHAFFQRLSPRKTLEGAVGGAVATIVVAALAGPPLIGINAAAGAGMGALIAIAAQGGDLAESALKRQAGVKDSSALIPGHGGLLDRIDSLVLVGPVVYCYLRLIAFP
ncbi:MAG: phosphatidate cytidylyltransferase [Candidatus Dormibacteria bacterium]